jgi:flagellar hook assembly protein FlgD
VRIAFFLAQAAAIEIDVFDVQGRRVASPARGEWSAGAHVIAWDGRTRSGQSAPAGLFLVRYRYPGGQDRRRIVRVQ